MVCTSRIAQLDTIGISENVRRKLPNYPWDSNQRWSTKKMMGLTKPMVSDGLAKTNFWTIHSVPSEH
jgi:hypothetical protein